MGDVIDFPSARNALAKREADKLCAGLARSLRVAADVLDPVEGRSPRLAHPLTIAEQAQIIAGLERVIAQHLIPFNITPSSNKTGTP